MINCDAGSYFLESPEPLIDICDSNESGMMIFENFPLKNRQFCKRDSFVNLDCDEEYFWNAVHCVAGVNLFKKTPYVTSFVKEWLESCQNIHSLTDLANKCGLPNLEGFIAHRHDQSVLSILVAKYKLETYRYPTVWGNFVKLPEFRAAGEQIMYPYGLQDIQGRYSDCPKANSPYGTIFQVNREPMGKLPNTREADPVKANPNKMISAVRNKIFRGCFKLMRKMEAKILPSNPAPIVQPQPWLQFAKQSYAQCAEDLIIDYVFTLRGILKPTYIDIGAHHPWFLSNTAYFYLKGCRGINVEPNPELIKNFHKERPEDINLNTGIGEKEEILRFYEISDNTLSTFSKQEADGLISSGFSIANSYDIQVVSLQKILSENFNSKFPDLLTIDVEGLEKDIIESIDFERSHPKIICVETAEYSSTGSGAKRLDLIGMIESKGYYLYADTNLNSIFVKNEFWFN